MLTNVSLTDYCTEKICSLQLQDGKQTHEDIYDFINEADWDNDGKISFKDLARYQYLGPRSVKCPQTFAWPNADDFEPQKLIACTS